MLTVMTSSPVVLLCCDAACDGSSLLPSVSVRGSPCTGVAVQRSTADPLVSTVTCLAPSGFGLSAPVVVSTPLQASAAVSIAYAAPLVLFVDTHGGRPIDGGFLISLRGQVRSGCFVVHKAQCAVSPLVVSPSDPCSGAA